LSDSLGSDDQNAQAAVEGAADWAVPVFRTINTPSGRHALRLEAAFWDGLARLAQHEGRKPTDLVRELVVLDRGVGANLSSTIRSAVVKRLLDRDASLAPLTAPLGLVKLMQLAPLPSFALNRAKTLVRVNEEFVRNALSKTGPVEKAQLKLDQPAETLFAEIAPGTAVECGISIRLDNHEHRTRARIVIPPAISHPILVGFISN
jgi:predicted DNA-binding ribbon-helix-helix protein